MRRLIDKAGVLKCYNNLDIFSNIAVNILFLLLKSLSMHENGIQDINYYCFRGSYDPMRFDLTHYL